MSIIQARLMALMNSTLQDLSFEILVTMVLKQKV